MEVTRNVTNLPVMDGALSRTQYTATYRWCCVVLNARDPSQVFTIRYFRTKKAAEVERRKFHGVLCIVGDASIP